MWSVVLILAFGTGAILLQTTVLHLIPIGSAVPDLVLVLAVYLGLHYHTVGGAVGAFSLGYLVDVFSGVNLGLGAFSMTLVYFTVHLTSRRLWIESGLSTVAVVACAALLKTASVAGLATVFSPALAVGELRDDLIGGGLAAAVSPLIFAALERGRRRLRWREHPMGGRG